MFEGLGTFKEKCITNIDEKCKSVVYCVCDDKV